MRQLNDSQRQVREEHVTRAGTWWWAKRHRVDLLSVTWGRWTGSVPGSCQEHCVQWEVSLRRSVWETESTPPSPRWRHLTATGTDEAGRRKMAATRWRSVTTTRCRRRLDAPGNTDDARRRRVKAKLKLKLFNVVETWTPRPHWPRYQLNDSYWPQFPVANFTMAISCAYC